jgi:UDP-hydrolysing UDP-N-acetyl-D-glucosamine 2-epimerase
MTQTNRTICVFTGTRAEYGLLYWLMKDIESDPRLKLRLIVSGSHLAREQGETWRQIEADGFSIDAKVDMKLDGDDPVATARSMALALSGAAEALDRLQPDIFVVLGDRYEALAVAEAALLLCIPIAHIHGGEASEGAFDDAMRHAITKLSHLHFAAAEPYRQRLIQMGEAPERVYNVGSPGLDYIARTDLAEQAELEELTGLRLGDQNLLVTYHAATLEKKRTEPGAQPLLSALDRFPSAHVIFTRANADPGGRLINSQIETWVARNRSRAICVPSLGQRLYLSAMSQCDAVVGNSSSGIIEAPAMGKPTVNIGSRQRGRERASSIIDCLDDSESITEAIAKAQTPEMRSLAQRRECPYSAGGASRRIKEVLADIALDQLLVKRFHKVS